MERVGAAASLCAGVILIGVPILISVPLPAASAEKASRPLPCLSYQCVFVPLPVTAGDDDADADEDEDAPKAKAKPGHKPEAKPAITPVAWPNTYIDFSTGFSSTPGGSLSLGLRGLTLTGSSSKSVALSAPLTIDLTDRVSIYGGIDGATSRTPTTPWTPLTLGNWSLGGSGDLIQQNGGPLPTTTISGGVSRAFKKPSIGALTTWTTGLDFDYALNADETRGLLAGLSASYSDLDNPTGTIHPIKTFYGGAYYQWDSGWKLTGRGGIQLFNGANVGAFLQVKPIRAPFVAFDLDRNDESGNRLLGLSLALGWTPKPVVQLTLSTPLYFVRN